jgi:hypothetical protein
VGQGRALPAVSPRTPAGHGPAPQALQSSILGKLRWDWDGTLPYVIVSDTTKVLQKDSKVEGFTLRCHPLLFSQVLANEHPGGVSCSGSFRRFQAGGPA